jgi:hypothetical protein
MEASTNRVSSLESLPTDMLETIYILLELADVGALLQTCKRINMVESSEFIWKTIAVARFNLSSHLTSRQTHWKEIVRSVRQFPFPLERLGKDHTDKLLSVRCLSLLFS